MRTRLLEACRYLRLVGLYLRAGCHSLEWLSDRLRSEGRPDLWLLYCVVLRVPLGLFMALYLAEEEMREEPDATG